MSLEKYIPVGEQNAIHLNDLAKLLNVHPCTIKNWIRDERKSGEQILSGINGYWYADNDHDKKTFVRIMRMQAESRLIVSECIAETIEESEVINDE